MSKLVTLIVRPKYSNKKQIKTDYKAQFPIDPMLNDKIKKQINSIKDTKKQLKSTRVNPLSSIFGSWIMLCEEGYSKSPFSFIL